jgi:hypothetical protein
MVFAGRDEEVGVSGRFIWPAEKGSRLGNSQLAATTFCGGYNREFALIRREEKLLFRGLHMSAVVGTKVRRVGH